MRSAESAHHRPLDSTGSSRHGRPASGAHSEAILGGDEQHVRANSRPRPTPRSQRFWDWLPDAVDRRIRVFAWLSFVAEVHHHRHRRRRAPHRFGARLPDLAAVHAGIARPHAGHDRASTASSSSATALMTGVVGILAVVLLVLVLRIRRERRDLFALAAIVVGGVVAQALVGGITVLTGLNPFIVGFHYVASLALVCVTAAFLVRMYAPAGPRVRAVPRWHAILATSRRVALGAHHRLRRADHRRRPALRRRGRRTQRLRRRRPRARALLAGVRLLALTLVLVVARVALAAARSATAALDPRAARRRARADRRRHLPGPQRPARARGRHPHGARRALGRDHDGRRAAPEEAVLVHGRGSTHRLCIGTV